MKQENTNKTKNNPKSLKNKFIIPLLLLSLVLIFSFTMGTVSAEFMSPSPTSSVIYVNSSNGSDDNNGLSWETAKLSILNATGTVDENGEINIADGQYTGTGNTNITITKNMTITGQSQTGTIINGTGTNWIFNIAYGVNVTIQNLTLTNGNSTYDGGAISNYGNLTVENCTFTDNTALWGGAIGVPAGYCTVNKCTFANNSALGDSYSGGGGAIAIGFSGTCIITNSIFISNNATNTSYGGGAIYNVGALTAHFNRIYNNNATNAKAIYGYSINAENNWWGSNNPNWSNLLSGTTNPNNWVILSINADLDTIYNGENSTITADFNHVNGGGNLVGGHIPDGPITLDIPWGSLTEFILSAYNTPANYPSIMALMTTSPTHSFTANTVNGVMTAIFYANEGAVNPLFNPVRVTATADGYTTNTTESAYITINPSADISVNITFEDTNHNPITSANYQDTVVIHLNVANNGPDMANWVVINDIIPPELDDSSFNIISNSPSWGYTYYYGSQRLTIYVGDIANGTSYDFWINVTNVGHNNNLITNTARLNTTETELYDPNPDNNNSTASYTAKSAANVFVKTTTNKTNPTIGEIITLTFKLGNRGPDPANDVVFTYRIPEGMEFVSLETEPGYPAATYDLATRTVTWSLGTVPILDPWLKINVKVLNAGVFNINPTVTTSTYDPNLGTNIQSATINAMAQINAASSTTKTIGMQNTGLPIPALILALLAVFTGLVLPRRK